MSERLEVYMDAEKVAERVTELGQQMARDLRDVGDQPLVLIGVLKGCFVFFADLLRAIDMPTNVAFLGVSSYGGATKTSGAVRLTLDLTMDIAGRDVMIVEDIVDTGLTMSYLVENLRARKPNSLRICSLLHKPAREQVHVPLDYVGFVIDDVFVVGYGLDYQERYRNVPYIGVLQLGDGLGEPE